MERLKKYITETIQIIIKRKIKETKEINIKNIKK
mgnify:CR=1 FL=1|jgi:hypothetical protein